MPNLVTLVIGLNLVPARDKKLTQMRANPMMTRPISEASQRPILWPRGPNKLVPIRYDMEAGRKAKEGQIWLKYTM